MVRPRWPSRWATGPPASGKSPTAVLPLSPGSSSRSGSIGLRSSPRMDKLDPLKKHPHRHLLARFGRGRLHRRRNLEIVRHLLADCPECRQAAAPRFQYDAAFARTWSEVERRRAALEVERAEAVELLRGFLALTPERQQALATTA